MWVAERDLLMTVDKCVELGHLYRVVPNDNGVDPPLMNRWCTSTNRVVIA